MTVECGVAEEACIKASKSPKHILLMAHTAPLNTFPVEVPDSVLGPSKCEKRDHEQIKGKKGMEAQPTARLNKVSKSELGKWRDWPATILVESCKTSTMRAWVP